MDTDSRPVLVLGATGTTGRRVVRELLGRRVPVRTASRHPTEGRTEMTTPVVFSWEDPDTHGPALEGARAVYLLAPPAEPDPATLMTPLLRRATEAGVERLVLLSASSVERGGPGLGQVHAAVADAGVGWAALRPTWFMQNLWNPGHPIGAAVRSGDDIVTATGNGRVAFVDAGDIARVAVHALTDATAPDGDLVLTGPAALSYEEVATLLTQRLGRTVRHCAVSAPQAIETMVGAGVPGPVAEMLAGMEIAIAGGAEDRVADTVERVTGRPARSLAEVLSADDPYEQELP